MRNARGQFVKGHKHSKVIINKIREVLKGNKNHLGKKHSEETKQKLGDMRRGKKSHRKGKTLEEEYGVEKAKQIREKISKAQKGRTPWNKGKKGLQVGWSKGLPPEKQPGWRGGKSFEPYSVDWTETLRRSIRERDKYTCQVCGKEPATHCHHIDYDKKNCNSNNLITLCQPCHLRTNQNRKKWQQYFYEMSKM